MVRQDPGIEDRHDDAGTPGARVPGPGKADATRGLAGRGAVIVVVPLLRKARVVREAVEDPQDVVRMGVLDVGPCTELADEIEGPVPRLGRRKPSCDPRRYAVDEFAAGQYAFAVLDPQARHVARCEVPGRLHLHDHFARDELRLGWHRALEQLLDLRGGAFLRLGGRATQRRADQGDHESEGDRRHCVLLPASVDYETWRGFARLRAPSDGEAVTGLPVLVLSAMLLGSPPPGRFVPGEVVVKFAPGTEASAAVMRAGRLSPPDLEALAPPVTALQAKTGLPLRAKQVTGGQWVLLAVDGEKLVKRLAEQLRGRANVADVRLSPEPLEGTGEASGSRGIVVRFSAGSAEAQAVA